MKYKIRRNDKSRQIPLLGEPVWGNGCECFKCLKPSVGSFIICPEDDVAREFCEKHGKILKEILASDWEASEKNNRIHGDFEAANRCRERADMIRKYGYYDDKVLCSTFTLEHFEFKDY